MFEIFTVRARQIISLGKKEAKDNGDDCVGTQHILIGLIREASGVGHHILENNGVSAKMVRDECKKIVQEGDGIEKDPPFSPRAKNLFSQAIEEATILGHRYVGTEHILLALLKEKESVAIQILTNFGLNIEQIRKETLSLLGYYDKDYQFDPTTDEKIKSVVIVENEMKDIIGRYDTSNDELFFNRPLSVEEIQRIISVLRRIQNDQKDR
jgi:ATP-dependent Clp protease ATP-binding subunit ClpC